MAPGEMNAVAIAHPNVPSLGPAFALSYSSGNLADLLSIKMLLQTGKVSGMHAFVDGLSQATRLSGAIRHLAGPRLQFTFSLLPRIAGSRHELIRVLAGGGTEGLSSFLFSVSVCFSMRDCSDGPTDIPSNVIEWSRLQPKGKTFPQLREELETQYERVRHLGFPKCLFCLQEGIQALEESAKRYEDWLASFPHNPLA